MNGAAVGRALDEKAEEFIAVAEGVYEAQTRHSGKPPILYEESFFFRRSKRFGVQSRLVGNSDPEAVYVEFGLNAGGKTYRYRVLGKTLDILAAEHA